MTQQENMARVNTMDLHTLPYIDRTGVMIHEGRKIRQLSRVGSSVAIDRYDVLGNTFYVEETLIEGKQLITSPKSAIDKYHAWEASKELVDQFHGGLDCPQIKEMVDERDALVTRLIHAGVNGLPYKGVSDYEVKLAAFEANLAEERKALLRQVEFMNMSLRPYHPCLEQRYLAQEWEKMEGKK